MAQATAPADIKTEGGGRRPKLILSYAALGLITLVFVAPLLWMISTSFKTNPETTQWPLSWIPREFSVEGYSELFNATSETLLGMPLERSRVPSITRFSRFSTDQAKSPMRRAPVAAREAPPRAPGLLWQRV